MTVARWTPTTTKVAKEARAGSLAAPPEESDATRLPYSLPRGRSCDDDEASTNAGVLVRKEVGANSAAGWPRVSRAGHGARNSKTPRDRIARCR